MIKKFIFSLAAGTAFLALSACGFHLRGHNELTPQLSVLYLQTENPYGSLEATLRQTLRSSGVTLVSKSSAAPITLQLSKPIETNSNATIGPSNQSRVYTLGYSVAYSLLNAKGKVLLGPETLQTSRNLVLSANQLPQSNKQADILSHEMERDIINQLYNRLRSQQVAQVLGAS